MAQLHVVCILKRKDMAKEIEVEQTQEKRLGNPPDILADALRTLMARPSGLTLNVIGEERPVTFCYGEFSDVTVDSAWIRFSYGGCVLRTHEIKDRNELWRWILDDRHGICTARFYKISGALKKPTEEEPCKAPFMPRSRYAHGRTPQRPLMVSGD